MKLKIIATGSKGNCYLLKGIKEDLLIECGIPFQKIKAALNFDFKRIKYCLLSHEHGDHAKAVKEISRSGIIIYSSIGTNERCNVLNFCSDKNLETEEFYISRFSLKHDAADAQGFLIESKTEFKKLIFITDTAYCKYNFSSHNIDYFMIEINYQHDLLEKNEQAGEIDCVRANRVRKSHFELDNAIKYVNLCKSPKTKAIISIHMSKDNLNIDFAKEKIEVETGLKVLLDRDLKL